jgi:hypothetical protein
LTLSGGRYSGGNNAGSIILTGNNYGVSVGSVYVNSGGASGNIILGNTAGSVGIGTSSPSATLFVQGTSTAATGTLFAVASSTGSSLFSILANGNVGIGSSTPIAKLSIIGDLNLAQSGTNALIIGNTTGNPRGTNAIDIQSDRTSITQVASGTNATAIGQRNTTNCSTGPCVAIGYGNTAGFTSGINSSAFGISNTAYGSWSTAVGSNNTISNTYDNASAIGSTNSVQNHTGSAFGYSNTAAGLISSAFGTSNYTIGQYSSAFGWRNLASNTFSSAFGASSTASGVVSTAIGYNNIASAQGASAFGSYITNNIASSTQIGPSDSAKMTILGTGNVGIGTTNPGYLLDAQSTGGSRSIFLQGDVGGGGGPYVSSYFHAKSSTDVRGRGMLLTSSAGEAGASWYAGVPYGGAGFQIGNSGYGGEENVAGPYQKVAAKFFINSTGLIGIGTTSPSSLLFVQSSSTTTPVFTVASSTGTSLFSILANGNIGIGTSTPGQKLTVVGDMSLTGAFYDSTAASGTFGQVLLSTGTSTIWTSTSSLGITGGSGVSGGAFGYATRFLTSSTLGTSTLLDNGTVLGVNATSSLYTFNLQGNAGIDPFNIASSTGTSLFSVLANGNIGIGSSTPVNSLTIDRSSSVASFGLFGNAASVPCFSWFFRRGYVYN